MTPGESPPNPPPPDGPTAGPCDRHGPTAEEQRLLSLAQLISPVVHRVNNSLAVLRGACDLTLQQHYTAHLLRASEETVRVADTLAQLSSCAKTHPPSDAPFDLDVALENALLLANSLSSSHGVEVLDRRGTGEQATVRGDRWRLEQVLVWFVGESLVGAPREEGAGARNARVRIVLRRRGARVRLLLLHGPAPPRRLASLAGARGLAREPALSVRAGTRLGTVTFLSFDFELLGPVPGPPQGTEPPRLAGRVLLVEADTARRELVHTVLEERGYRVRLPARDEPTPEELPLGAVDVVLIDAEQAMRRPGFLPEMLRCVGTRGRGRVALLGAATSAPGADQLPMLPEPFRPQELLAFVAAVLS